MNFFVPSLIIYRIGSIFWEIDNDTNVRVFHFKIVNMACHANTNSQIGIATVKSDIVFHVFIAVLHKGFFKGECFNNSYF